MDSCPSCNAKSKQHINTYKKVMKHMNHNYVSAIMKYIKISNIYIFHTTCDNTNHMICNKCFNELLNIAIACDTNMVQCPTCSQLIFIGK